MLRKGIVGVILTATLWSCESSSNIKEIRDLKQSEWFSTKPQIFSFDIKDISKPYKFSYLLRVAGSYPYYNLYLKQKLVDHKGNIVIQSQDEALLFHPKTGQPYGSGLGDIYDYRLKAALLKQHTFKKAGKYKWIISHNMRPDPLEGILSVGAEIEVVAAQPTK